MNKLTKYQRRELINLLREKHKADNHGISVNECGYDNCLIKEILKKLGVLF